MGLQVLCKILLICTLMVLVAGAADQNSKSPPRNTVLQKGGKFGRPKYGNTNIEGSGSFQFGGNILSNRYCGAICSWAGKSGGYYLSNKLDFFALFNFNGNCLCTCPVPYPINADLCSSSSCNSVCQYNKYLGGSCDDGSCNCLCTSDQNYQNSASSWVLPPTSQVITPPDLSDDGCPGDCPDTGVACVTKPKNPNARVGCFPYGNDFDTLAAEEDDGEHDIEFPFTFLGVDYPAIRFGNDGWFYFFDNTVGGGGGGRSKKVSSKNGTKKGVNKNKNAKKRVERGLNRATTCLGYEPGEDWNVWNVDMDNRVSSDDGGGFIWFRVSDRALDRARALAIVQAGFPDDYDDATVDRVFVATWDDMSYNQQVEWGPQCPGNTFQAVVIKGPEINMLFTCYLNITWVANDDEDYCHGQGYESTAAGDDFPLISIYDSTTDTSPYEYLGSCSRGVKALMYDSNMDQPGKWLFDVKTATVGQPDV